MKSFTKILEEAERQGKELKDLTDLNQLHRDLKHMCFELDINPEHVKALTSLSKEQVEDVLFVAHVAFERGELSGKDTNS